MLSSLFVCLFFPCWARLSEVVLQSAEDWVCISLLVVEMRHPAQGATGSWVMLGLVFRWFPLCGFSLFDTPSMAPHSNTLAWKIPWMEGPGGLQSIGLQRVGHD